MANDLALSNEIPNGESEKTKYKQLISTPEIRTLLSRLTEIFYKLANPGKEENEWTFRSSCGKSLKDLKPLDSAVQAELLHRFDFSAFLQRYNRPGLLVVTNFAASDPRVQDFIEGDDPYEPPIVVENTLPTTGKEVLALVKLDREVRTNVTPITTSAIMDDPSRLSLYVDSYAERTNSNLYIGVSMVARWRLSSGKEGESIDPWLLGFFTNDRVLGVPIYHRASLFEAGLRFHFPTKTRPTPGIFYEEQPQFIEQVIDCVGLGEPGQGEVSIPHDPKTDMLFSLIHDNLNFNTIAGQLTAGKGQD